MLRVLIPSAGLGSRLDLKTKHINKALISIGNKAAISRIIESFPVKTEFVIALGYKGSLLKKYLKIDHT